MKRDGELGSVEMNVSAQCCMFDKSNRIVLLQFDPFW